MGSGTVLPFQTLCKFVHSTLLQFSQSVNENLAVDSDGYLHENQLCIMGINNGQCMTLTQRSVHDTDTEVTA